MERQKFYYYQEQIQRQQHEKDLKNQEVELEKTMTRLEKEARQQAKDNIKRGVVPSGLRLEIDKNHLSRLDQLNQLNQASVFAGGAQQDMADENGIENRISQLNIDANPKDLDQLN